jgi:hypothetical protein
MAYTARMLITRAYYLSQIVSRQLQEVSGEQIEDGLFLLNALLQFKSTDLREIPYFKRDTLTLTAGVGEYFIERLLYVDAMTYNIGDVRYPMTELTRKQFFATGRVDSIQSLPFSYRVEREKGGSRIFLYFLPQGNYVLKLSGKFGLTNVTLDTDLSTIYDEFYIEFLRYQLAQYICSDYGATFPDESKAKLKEMEDVILDVSPPDLSLTRTTFFSGQSPWDWQAINLSKGYFPF